MIARDNTLRMLRWWRGQNVDLIDLAVRRQDGAMAWHHELALPRGVPLAWARYENAHGADVYLRPARGYEWPLVFLDDVDPVHAVRVTRKYQAMAVQTSPAGGCHLWLACTRPMGEYGRAHAQRWLAERLGGDPASVSGEHLGRLAGFRNWKRGGVWVNVRATAHGFLRPWDPSVAVPLALELSGGAVRPATAPQGADRDTSSRDNSPSGREWAWVCEALENGRRPEQVYRALVARARPRRGRDAERYARRTVERALRRVQERTGHNVGELGLS